MQGQKVLSVGGQGPVSAPAARLLAPDNQVFAMARFSDPQGRRSWKPMGSPALPTICTRRSTTYPPTLIMSITPRCR
jgi:hypothetical protein